MNHCKECKWWEDEEVFNIVLKTCNQPNAKKGYDRECVPINGVRIENDEGWAWLTGPEFGCINWECK